MLSWATSQLESLAQTVAPPPTDPVSKYIYCCQRGDEAGALEVINQINDPLRSVIQTGRGQTALHLACLAGMLQLTQQILRGDNQFQTIVDLEGNTPLHCACTSSNTEALDLVKYLLHLAPPSAVSTKNSLGQTLYDVASLNTTRQYLLPIQLQAETQAALDNGGVGLPPGIDLGGLTIKRNVAPPPIIVPPTTPAPAALPSPSMFTTPSPHPPLQHRSMSEPASTPRHTQSATNSAGVPQPPTSSGSSYALTGRSSAAILTSKNGIQPDGFHSSSSDKSLQQKYGHVNSGNAPALPPPPSSGNYTGNAIPMSAPPSLGGGTNPYAGGVSALGSSGRRPMAARRYVAYDPVSGVVVAPPASNAPTPQKAANPAAFNAFTPPSPVSTGSSASGAAMFNPSHQSPSAVPSPQATGTYSSPTAGTAFATASATAGGVSASAESSSPLFARPPGRAGLVAAPSSGNASELFAKPSLRDNEEFVPQTVANPADAATSAPALFARPPTSLNGQPATTTAAFAKPPGSATALGSMFARPPSFQPGKATNLLARPPVMSAVKDSSAQAEEQANTNASEPMLEQEKLQNADDTATMQANETKTDETNAAMQQDVNHMSTEFAMDDDGLLDDIPLTPGVGVTDPAAETGNNSLLSMPPPPFSKK